MHQLEVDPIILGCIKPYRIIKYLNAWSISKASLPSEHSISCPEEKYKIKVNTPLSPYHLIIPRENFISEIISFLW